MKRGSNFLHLLDRVYNCFRLAFGVCTEVQSWNMSRACCPRSMSRVFFRLKMFQNYRPWLRNRIAVLTASKTKRKRNWKGYISWTQSFYRFISSGVSSSNFQVVLPCHSSKILTCPRLLSRDNIHLRLSKFYTLELYFNTRPQPRMKSSIFSDASPDSDVHPTAAGIINFSMQLSRGNKKEKFDF